MVYHNLQHIGQEPCFIKILELSLSDVMCHKLFGILHRIDIKLFTRFNDLAPEINESMVFLRISS